ncbi:MAG: hypothetical protein H7Z10_01930 [Gemmatimonadaceae bacterium]|nr:hypothetical protein [Acetobacteraceae bacterium]
MFAERPGQLLRQALQQRLEGSGSGVAKRFELIATIALSAEGIGLLRDSTSSRVRLVGTAPWVLRTLSLERTIVAQGTSRALDGYNILNQQYFAADLSNQAATLRITEALADQITTQLGSFFLREATAAG